ncbi:iron transporter [Vibrio vulnificus]|nr:iron transporter [Vibrio vulnificus]EIV1777697.1 iron transporter [Vibrio vulnificus]EIZ0992219.1 iron transporter [Vibrio vulnificus]ELF6474445.1 iron transporter [Vibrio vulnificus]ELX4149038.1 iron transporter [Vibrio vulnificus]
MVAVVVFEFSGMRCQPLRRALGVSRRWKICLTNGK